MSSVSSEDAVDLNLNLGSICQGIPERNEWEEETPLIKEKKEQEVHLYDFKMQSANYNPFGLN